MPILFALAGATGIGKTELSLQLAEHYDAEIVCVDSRQVYRGFSIGTAQPDVDSLRRVKHHLVDFLAPTESFSAGAFCKHVKEILSENPQKNFILVGGTGLYLQSLMLGLPQIPPVSDGVREELECLAREKGADTLYKMALEADPELTGTVEPNNVQRLIRILEVFRSTGRRLSEFQKDRRGGIGSLPVFWLQRERDALYKRIDLRVDQMLRDGWLDEARGLSAIVPLSAPAWQSLGYLDLLQAKNEAEVREIAEIVKKKTRNYAKRQLTWFRWQLESVPVDMENSPDKAILNFFQRVPSKKL